MKTKKIANIVFYKYYGENGAAAQACIFYNDGTVKQCTYDDGIDAVLEIVREEKITSKDALRNMINSKRVHVMSGYDFENNFKNYIVNEETEEKDDEKVDTTSDEKDDSIGYTTIKNPEDDIEVKPYDPIDTPPTRFVDDEEEIEDEIDDEDEDDYENDDEDDYGIDDDEEENNIGDSTDTEENTDEEEQEKEDEDEKVNSKGKVSLWTRLKRLGKRIKAKAIAIGLTIALGLGGTTATTYALTRSPKTGKMMDNTIGKLPLLNKLTKKSKNKKSSASKTTDNNVVPMISNGDNKDNTSKTTSKSSNKTVTEITIDGDNDFYDDYSFDQLQKVNSATVQRKAMKNAKNAIYGFNDTFANAHTEHGKDIKAALSWREVMALQQAYNNYSGKSIKAIFNGSEMSADKLSRAYKDANLQLMGAHVIENRENPVDMSMLINSKEGKEFYNRYHEMFLQIKEASGQDQIDKVNAWRAAVLNDLPISDEIREVGIAHADSRNSIDNYKLSITPMIAAVEIMYQNLETDNTLSDKMIYYLNDLGMCNLADSNFDKVQAATLSAEEDDTQPLYRQYRDAIVKDLKLNNNYVIDDAHRDLSQLDAFQAIVNGHFQMQDGHFTGEIYYTTETYATVSTHQVVTTKYWTETSKETTSDRDYAVSKTSEEAVRKAEEKVDKQIEKENEKAKEKAEKEAEENRKKQQEEADKEKEKLEEDVKKDDEDLQDKIDDANNQIDKNHSDNDTTNDDLVNEDDFGDHNVDFDDNHSDNQGNLDDSVQDVTTDPSGDQTGDDLPDPNQTGQEFEQNTPETNPAPAPEVADPVPEAPAPAPEVADPVPEAPAPAPEVADPVPEAPAPAPEVADPVPEAPAPAPEVSDPVPEAPAPAPEVQEYEEPVEESQDISNEEIAFAIIEEMAKPLPDSEKGYQYRYRR